MEKTLHKPYFVNKNLLQDYFCYYKTTIYSARFTASSLSILVYLAEGNHRFKSKHGHDKGKCKRCGIKYKCCECCLENTNVKNDLGVYKCLLRYFNFKPSFKLRWCSN